jgi:HAD superfamily hydrolase (TIGR01509 family)
MPIKAVIFDLDGTITRPFLDFDLIRRQIGLSVDQGPLLEAMEKMSPSQRAAAEAILHYHEQKAADESVLNPGAANTLLTLRQNGIQIGIVTRNRKVNAFAVAKKHNLVFDAVVGREDGPVKPDAFGVTFLCQKFGISPLQTIMVGDFLFDLLCAKAAGVTSILLLNTPKAHEFKHHADFVIDKIDQILTIIQLKGD